jgi:23S rRNA (adenine2503-C2)-methyltransferase
MPTNKTAASTPIPLSGKSLSEIEDFVVSIGLPKYRAEQIHSWIYAKYAQSFDEMTNLSKEVKELLKSHAQIPLLKLAHIEISKDSTRKYLFELPDGQLIESVLMQFSDRSSLSACVSSQVGCAVGCTFCATGYLGFKRNLTHQEIVDQIMSIQRESGKRVSNIVYMGQGEPLLNTRNVIRSIKTINSSVGVGARHITVSTAGIIPGIQELAEAKIPVTLALSLHAPDGKTRREIVPITNKFPIPELMTALKQYYQVNKRRITIEYVMLKDITDSDEQAKELAELTRDIHCNINLIPYNPVLDNNGEAIYLRPKRERQEKFKKLAKRYGKVVTIRLERGSDINAACGQLHNAVEESL